MFNNYHLLIAKNYQKKFFDDGKTFNSAFRILQGFMDFHISAQSFS